MQPQALILRTAGTNCDRELAWAFQRAGAVPQICHVDALIADPGRLSTFELIGIPGGFSYGDDIAAGRILANRLRHRLMDQLQHAVAGGTPIIGICNGFQVLVKLGLLPDPASGQQTVTLTHNIKPRFLARWVELHAESGSNCLWTRGLDRLELPVAHGEGRLVLPTKQSTHELEKSGQVALRYAPDQNPNGSVADIAGLCDPSGLVLGLMPHPERYTDPTHHPQWARDRTHSWTQKPAGLRMFENAVEHVQNRPAAASA